MSHLHSSICGILALLAAAVRERKECARPVEQPPNGEVEGPGTHVDQAPRAHTVPRRPRRQTDHASRPPPTIVRRHGANAQCAVPRVATATRWYRAKPATRAANRQRHESSGLVDTCTRGRRYDRPLARSWYRPGLATCRHLHRGLRAIWVGAFPAHEPW